MARGRSFLVGLALSGAYALAAGACTEVTPPPNDPACPNELVTEGGACEAGLVCSYAEPTSCARYFTATCENGAWVFDRPCDPTGGNGGVGNQSEGGDGGTAGQGGVPMCEDPEPGAPLVTSVTNVLYAPDRNSGFYELTFSESVSGVGPSFTWAGAGTLGAVTKVGNVYRVFYSGIAAGEEATLTIDGVTDDCDNPLEAPVDVTIALRPNCHALAEAFEGDFLDDGWTTEDGATDGLLWDSSDAFDFPNGVPNHTEGTGFSASANDIDSLSSETWDASLISPLIDLTGLEDVVLRYQTAFQDVAGTGAAWLEISTDGTSWSTLDTYTDDRTTLEVVDLSSYGGQQVYLRWRYDKAGGLGSWWDVDDVCVETFTRVTCACAPGGVTEQNDVDGVSDGNGEVFTAELTTAVLNQVGDRIVVCGDVEDGSLSGADFFRFVVGSQAGPLTARVSYCVENPFQPGSSAVWHKSVPEPLGIAEGITGAGTYEVPLTAGLEHFVSIAPEAPGYTSSRYRMTVDVIGSSTPVLEESFEVWPPMAFTITDDDPCLDWQQASQTTVPTGTLPTDGFNLGYFNSYDCSTGSEALESGPVSLAGVTSVMLSFDMFHDPGYPGALDTIQVEYNTGSNWIPIGSPVERPGPVAQWENHIIDLSALAGASSVRIRLFATTAYGNNVHIDNVVMLTN